MKKRTFLFFLLTILIVMATGILIYSVGIQKDETFALRPTDALHAMTDEEMTITEIPVDGYAGIARIYAFPCPELPQLGETLSVFCIHQYVEIQIGNEIVYQKEESESPHLGKTPGLYYALVPLKKEDVGQTISIRITPVYESNQSVRPDIIITTPEHLYMYYWEQCWGEFLISAFCMLAGVIFIVIGLLTNFSENGKRSIIYLGSFAIVFAVSRFFDQEVVSLIASNQRLPGSPKLFTYLSLSGFMLIPYFAARFLYEFKDQKRFYYYLSQAECLIAMIFLALQLSGVSDLRENLVLMTMNMTICIAVVVLFTAAELITDERQGRLFWFQYLHSIVLIGGIADLIVYFINDREQVSCITLFLILVYCIVYIALEIRRTTLQRDKLQETELELENQRVATLMTQIQPHFIVNTMAAIYSLCDRNTAAAKQAILDLSGYLRKNFESVGKTEPIPVREELEHVQFYVAIQKIRYGEKLKVIYDIACDTFHLPALTIQPLVENAVQHGIREKMGEGQVVVSTRETGDYYEVSVEDDGIGFQVKKGAKAEGELYDGKRQHLGIKNVKDRLSSMCGGSLQIKSELGKGTRVVIRIPKSKEE